MLGAIRVDKAFKEVVDLLTVRHLDCTLDLLVEPEQTREKFGVVGGLPDAQRMQQIERSLARYFRFALRQVGRL